MFYLIYVATSLKIIMQFTVARKAETLNQYILFNKHED